MQVILNGINGQYLRNIIENAKQHTEQVIAAVAYATDADLLFKWCWDNKIPLKFYGRLDDEVAVRPPILSEFLKRNSPNYVCRLVSHHHAKVIWWRGYGLYIGSANLTGAAWFSNVEAGCFFEETEISDEMGGDILAMFDLLEAKSTPLTDEILQVMEQRSRALYSLDAGKAEFWRTPSIRSWSGLAQTAAKNAFDHRRSKFLEEWYATLQELRHIGNLVSAQENRPRWVDKNSPTGAQADQFLHAHYYMRTFDGRRAAYAEHFERNKMDRERALAEAVAWWKEQPRAPQKEDEMLNVTAPYLREALRAEAIQELTEDQFTSICGHVHSIRDYSRRVPNKVVGLRDSGQKYSMDEKVFALAKWIWSNRTADGKTVGEVLHHILYGGSTSLLPERLWQSVADPRWKIDGLGVSSWGELVGWALPEIFPPRNGRTSKALKSLGYEVVIHVE